MLCVRESGVKTLKQIQRKGEEREGGGGGGEEREIVSDGETDSKHGSESAVIVFDTTQIFCCVIVYGMISCYHYH